jgi:hypothetical protein
LAPAHQDIIADRRIARADRNLRLFSVIASEAKQSSGTEHAEGWIASLRSQ